MKDFILPDIGEGIVECELLKWLVSEGETVKEDQAVAEVMTDKATVEIPAMDDGVVAKLYYQEGDIAKVHEPLFALDSTGLKATDNRGASLSRDDSSSKASKQESANRQPASAQNKSNPHGEDQIESFILPDIGEGIVECEIVEWLVQEGDEVKEDQVVVEVMTDKAVVEIPAKHAGKIDKLHYNKGDIAAVHSALFDQVIANQGLANQVTSGESKANQDDDKDKQYSGSDKQTTEQSSNSPTWGVSSSSSNKQQGARVAPPVEVGRALASPAVRRLAREQDCDLQTIKGSGPKGRVLKQDVLDANKFAEKANSSSVNAQNTASNKESNNNQNTGLTKDRVEPIKGIRAAMAKQMTQSVQNIVHFSVSDELCMDELIALRKKLKPEFEKQSIKLSFLPFFIKALSMAMLEYPVINSRVNKEVSELTYLSSHNIGVAVDSKIGLVVPNIKNVESRSIFDIAKALNDIIERARTGKLSKQDLSGGTVSISNIGAIGGMTATPIINEPEVAIVALGKTQKLPRFDADGNVVASNVMMLNWSGDHRIIDGATMVRFNNLWMEYLQQPELMLANLR